nr:hypothetical protein [Candidatus Anoxychlamydiales bacterium]
IISRPPETYAILYNPKSGYLFFDPHGSKYANYKPRNFKSPKFLIEHLMDLKPIDKESLELPEFYETEIGMNQNPNACEIRILRKKEDVSKEDEIESKKKEIISEGKREKKGSSPDKLDLSEEKRLEQAEAEALEHALRLSTNTLPISSSDAPKGMEEGDFSSRSSSSSIPDSLFDDELFAYSLQFEENELGHVSSRSSQIAPSFEEAPLSEEEQMRIATEESLAYSSDEEKIEDFTRYHEDNCWINGESLNKYAAIITILSTPTAQDETLPLINDLNDLLDSFGIKFTAELFGDILDLRDQKDITRKFETFKKLIEKGPESERDRHRRFQEYVDDYFRRIRLYKRYNFFK